MHRPQTQTWQCGRMTRPLVVPEVPEWRGRGGCVGVCSQQGSGGHLRHWLHLIFFDTQRSVLLPLNETVVNVQSQMNDSYLLKISSVQQGPAGCLCWILCGPLLSPHLLCKILKSLHYENDYWFQCLVLAQ